MSRAQQVDALWSGLRDSSGDALSGGLVYTYYSGSTSPVSLYTAQDKTTPATNPIVLDSEGKAKAWADGAYKFIIKTSAGVTVDTLDSLIYGFPEVVDIYAGNSSGSANAYVLTPSPALSAYTNGQTLSFAANFTNSGAATVNVSGLGAKDIKTGAGSALSSGAITSGNIVSLTYDSVAGYFILNVSNSFTTITVSGAGAFGSVVSPTLASSGAISINPSNVAKWQFSAAGALTPITNDDVGIGDSTHHVFSAYIKNLLVATGSTLGFGVGASATWSLSSNHWIPTADDTYNFGTPSFRVSKGYFDEVFVGSTVSSIGSPFYFGSGGGSWVVDSDSIIWPTGTSGTQDFGKSNRRIKDFYFSGKLDNGQSYTLGTYTALRSITHPSSGFLSGSDSVNRATLESHLQYLYRLIATLIDDTVA